MLSNNKVNSVFVFSFLLLHCIGQLSGQSCTFSKWDMINKNALQSCQSIVLDNVEVPGGKSLELNLKKGTSLSFRGKTTFGFENWTGYLIRIDGDDLQIRGEPGSIIDGQGQLYWDGNGQWGSDKPQLMTIRSNNSLFENITVLNAPKHGITIEQCNNVEFRHWLVNNSFGDEDKHPDGKFGHNTDGFAVKVSTNVHIHHCDVYNQDDCVVVGSGENIHVSNMYCHNSHGLSISTGLSNDTTIRNIIKNLTFADSFVDGGDNGIHVKSRKNGGFGSVTDVTYRNIEFGVTILSGINIQQNYMNTPAGQPMDPTPRNNVPFHNFTLENIYGTVTDSAYGYYINCAEGACTNFIFKNVTVIGGNNNTCNLLFPNFTC